MMLLKIRLPALCSESRGLVAIIMFEIQLYPNIFGEPRADRHATLRCRPQSSLGVGN